MSNFCFFTFSCFNSKNKLEFFNDFLLFHGVAAAEGSVPLRVSPLLHFLCEEGKDGFGVDPDAHFHGDDLSNLGRVYIYVDHLGLAGISLHRTGYAVVEAHTHGY